MFSMYFLCIIFFISSCQASTPPNILLIVADDLGRLINAKIKELKEKLKSFIKRLSIIKNHHDSFIRNIFPGYNDISWHNPDIISPNLEKLAKNGVTLENHYVQPICTPTR